MKKVTEDRERKKRERKKREKKERQRERRNYEKTERINVKDDDKEGGEEIEKTEPLPEDSHSTANPEPFKSHEMNKINQTRIKGDDLVIFKELIATVNEFSIETKKTLFFQNMLRSQRTGHPPKNESVSVSSNYPTSLSQTPITSVPRSEHAHCSDREKKVCQMKV